LFLVYLIFLRNIAFTDILGNGSALNQTFKVKKHSVEKVTCIPFTYPKNITHFFERFSIFSLSLTDAPSHSDEAGG